VKISGLITTCTSKYQTGYHRVISASVSKYVVVYPKVISGCTQKYHQVMISFQYYPLIYIEIFQVVSFPHASSQNPVCNSPLPVHAACQTHLILFDFIIRMMSGEEYRSKSSSFCSFLHSTVTSFL